MLFDQEDIWDLLNPVNGSEPPAEFTLQIIDSMNDNKNQLTKKNYSDLQGD